MSVTAISLRAKALGMGLVLAGLVGCGGGGDWSIMPPEPIPPMTTTAPETLTIADGVTMDYTARAGVKPYVANTSNPGVATVKFTGDAFAITGVSDGKAEITIKDGAGSVEVISVTIASKPAVPMTMLPTASTAMVGSVLNFRVSGGTPPYKAAVNNVSLASVSEVAMDATGYGGTLSVTLLKAGSTPVIISDALGQTTALDVTATTPVVTALSLVPSAATAAVGDELSFRINGGTSNYGAIVNNINIASITLLKRDEATAAGYTMKVKLLKIGSTSIAITDSAGNTAQLVLIVNAVAVAPLPQPVSLTLSPPLVLIGEDATSVVPFQITGGTGPYQAFTSNSSLSDVSVSGSTVHVGPGPSLRCIPGGTLNVIVTVIDKFGATTNSTLGITDNGGGTEGCGG